jgi:hypothetical protein
VYRLNPLNCLGRTSAALWTITPSGAAVCLLVAVVTCVPPRALAQPSMQTILTNGPVSNRLNIVVLSEGYTSGQLAQFSMEATNAVNGVLSHAPYQEYRSYFNAYAIKVASSQSGSTHPAQPPYTHITYTYFNSIYDPDSDLLITIPPDWADTNYSHGQGKVDALLQDFMPYCQLPILLVNDTTDGGSDGFYKTAIVATADLPYEMPPQPPHYLTHETGHVLANLSDEYTYVNPYAGAPSTEGSNTTQQTNRAQIKWNAWISSDTPVPTADNVGDGVLGLFQGAQYHTNNWYRPELNCAMKAVGVQFCSVCSEALVLAIYQRVRPVDGFSPTGTSFSVTTTQALAFSVILLQPATHNLNVQWLTNGVPRPGATNVSFTLLPQSFANGTNWVSAVVKDNTSLVRNDPTNLLSQTISWTLNVSIPQLHLDSPQWLTGGKFAFRVTGTAPQGVVVQSSTDLKNWGPVATNALVGGQSWYTNASASGSPRKFYRATTPP